MDGECQQQKTLIEDAAQNLRRIEGDLSNRQADLEQRERMLQETLVTTQRMVEEMKDNARREAQLLIKEAEMQGEKTIEAARTAEGAIQAQISQLKRTRRQLAESLRATVDMYQRLLDQDLEADANQGDGG